MSLFLRAEVFPFQFIEWISRSIVCVCVGGGGGGAG